MSVDVQPKGLLEKEKIRKENIQQVKFQREFLTEQTKLMKAQNERLRATVEEQELSARSWKAYFEKMYYSLESEKLESVYEEYQKRAKERIAKQKEDATKFEQELRDAVEEEEGEKHTITIEDLQANPELVEQGMNVGDEVILGPETDSEGNILTTN